MSAEPTDNSKNKYSLEPQQAEQNPSEPKLLSIEYVKITKPSEMYGDLHISEEGFYFAAFGKVDSWKQALYANLGLIGMWLEHRAKTKRQKQMADWRTQHGGVFLDELIQQWPNSIFVFYQDIKLIKSSFLSTGIVIEYSENQKLVLELPGKQVKEILAFAKEQNWPVK